jgi:hypothetical protein
LKVAYGLTQLLKTAVYALVTKVVRLLRLEVSGALQRHVMSTQNSLSLTLIPFSDIVRANQMWVDMALKASGAADIEYEEGPGEYITE